MARIICRDYNGGVCGLDETSCNYNCEWTQIAKHLYNAGYRKQSKGEWIDNHCSICGMTPIGDEVWTEIGLTPPKFEYFMSFCPCCGARMKGGAE